MNDWTPEKIKRLRKAAGMTQVRLADWLGVVPLHVSHLECGSRPAGAQTVRLLNVLAELQSGELRRVQPKTKSNKRRTR